ncbi:MAG TPA: hypothetical protein PK313_10700, partial [Myxococcota bacterium]|nr:hypothetical protein [Myxococcota bacterium]
MSRRSVGLIVLAVASLALGIFAGLRFFHLFEITVPPAVLTDFNRGTSRWAFIVYGLVAAAVLYAWSLLVVLLAPLFRNKAKPAPAP